MMRRYRIVVGPTLERLDELLQRMAEHNNVLGVVIRSDRVRVKHTGNADEIEYLYYALVIMEVD